MSRLPTLTGEFVVGSDPELRFTPSGKAVCTVSVKATESKKNPATNQWENGDSTPWISVSLWDAQAELAAETIRSGMRVLVTGALYVRTYEKRDGSEGQSVELKWATVAPMLAAPKTAERSGGYTEDPWTTPRTDGSTEHHVPADPWARPGDPIQQTEPPF